MNLFCCAGPQKRLYSIPEIRRIQSVPFDILDVPALQDLFDIVSRMLVHRTHSSTLTTFDASPPTIAACSRPSSESDYHQSLWSRLLCNSDPDSCNLLAGYRDDVGSAPISRTT